jgi:hypothetical protein
MSLATFKKALDLPYKAVYLGGGEPTIHPEFWDFLDLAMARKKRVGLSTNGKIKEVALELLKPKYKNLVPRLSVDDWHEEIDPEVVAVYKKRRRAIWLQERGLMKYGRSPRGRTDVCCCATTFIRPNGNIYFCACDDAPQIGTVDGIKPEFQKMLDEQIRKSIFGAPRRGPRCHKEVFQK